jgi:transcriptional regulator with XRE-family HTH domain
MDLGKNIKEMRRRRGLTQEELGKIIGVEKSTISRWESGDRKLNIDHIKNIALVLEIPLGALLSDNDLYESSRDWEGSVTKDKEHQDHKIQSDLEMVKEETENFDTHEIVITLPKIDDPELLQAFEGFKELKNLTPQDLEDIKAILKLANSIIEKRTAGR